MANTGWLTMYSFLLGFTSLILTNKAIVSCKLILILFESGGVKKANYFLKFVALFTMEAKNSLKQLIQMFSVFDAHELDRVVGCFETRLIKKSEILLSVGDVSKEFYFINRGCIRTYFISKQGHEKTRYLMIEPSIGTALTSFISQKPSFEFIDALEETELLAISHRDFYRLVNEVAHWKNFYLKIMEMAYSFQNRKIESLVTLTAKERYEQLLQENPKVVLRLSNKVIASYLDIKQETLSRLKSK